MTDKGTPRLFSEFYSSLLLEMSVCWCPLKSDADSL
jgi:hypothetical protein